MRCEIFKAKIDDFFKGRLTPEEGAELVGHRLGCDKDCTDHAAMRWKHHYEKIVELGCHEAIRLGLAKPNGRPGELEIPEPEIWRLGVVEAIRQKLINQPWEMFITCEEFNADLDNIIHGDAKFGQRSAIQHLDHCEACRKRLKARRGW